MQITVEVKGGGTMNRTENRTEKVIYATVTVMSFGIVIACTFLMSMAIIAITRGTL